MVELGRKSSQNEVLSDVMKMKDIHIERKTSQEKEDGRNKQRREPLYQSRKELGTSAIRHNIFFHCVGLVSKKAGLTSQGLVMY